MPEKGDVVEQVSETQPHDSINSIPGLDRIIMNLHGEERRLPITERPQDRFGQLIIEATLK